MTHDHEALREAALFAQTAIGNVLGNGGTNISKWFDDLVKAQQMLSRMTNGSRSDFNRVRDNYYREKFDWYDKPLKEIFESEKVRTLLISEGFDSVSKLYKQLKTGTVGVSQFESSRFYDLRSLNIIRDWFKNNTDIEFN
jgi:hypothetical protein